MEGQETGTAGSSKPEEKSSIQEILDRHEDQEEFQSEEGKEETGKEKKADAEKQEEEKKEEAVQNDEPSPKESSGEKAPDEKTTPETPVITKELAAEFGVPDSFAGQPLAELAKAYKSLVGDYTKKAQELSQLKAAPPTQHKEPAEEKKAEEKKDQEPETVPDPIEDPKGYARFIRDSIKSAVQDEMQKSIAPIQENFNKQQAEQKKAEVVSGLQKELPGVDVNEAVNSWAGDNRQIIEAITKGNPNYFAENPDFLISEVVRHYKEKNPPKAEEKKPEEKPAEKDPIAEAKKVAEKINNASAKKHNYSVREDGTPVNSTLAEIIQRNSENF